MGLSRHVEFCDQIKRCPTEAILTARLKEERRYLSSVYNTQASLKSALTGYRNVVRSPFFEHPHLDVNLVRQVVVRELNLTPEEIESLNTQYKEQVIQDMENLRFIKDVDGHIERSLRLLRNQSYLDVIIGLAALTGRRMAEIGTSARFKSAGNGEIIFDGQLKTKGRKDIGPYEIPVLNDSRSIVVALNSLRKTKSDLIGNPRQFHDRCSKDINRRVKKHYEGLYTDPLRPKDLRSIYAEICYRLHGSETISRPLYYSRVLGHDSLDVQTAQSYDDFRIKDPNFE